MTNTPNPAPSRPERKATIRLGQRELSRITLVFALFIAVGASYGVYRMFLGFKAQRDIVISKDNLRSLYQAFKSYSQDFDGKLPPTANWTGWVSGYLPSTSRPGGRMALLHGPSDEGEIGYVYNTLAAGYDYEPQSSFLPQHQKTVAQQADPDHLILLIERPNAPINATAILPYPDSPEHQEELYKQLSFPHSGDGGRNQARTVILYTSGRIEVVQRKDMRP